MIGLFQKFSKFADGYLRPFTQHRLWSAVYPWLVILLGLMSACQEPYLGAVTRVLFAIILLVFFATFLWLRIDPESSTRPLGGNLSAPPHPDLPGNDAGDRDAELRPAAASPS